MKKWAGQKKVPYIDFIRATTPTGYGEFEGRPMWTYYDHNEGPEIAVEKVHDAKTWYHWSITQGNLQSLISQKLIRHYIRNNKPVVVRLSMPGENKESPPDLKEGFAVLIGFATEQGKSTYEAFMIYGPAYLGSRVYPPITTEYKSKINPEYFSLAEPQFIE